jgi:hypothetical protein
VLFLFAAKLSRIEKEIQMSESSGSQSDVGVGREPDWYYITDEYEGKVLPLGAERLLRSHTQAGWHKIPASGRKAEHRLYRYRAPMYKHPNPPAGYVLLLPMAEQLCVPARAVFSYKWSIPSKWQDVSASRAGKPMLPFCDYAVLASSVSAEEESLIESTTEEELIPVSAHLRRKSRGLGGLSAVAVEEGSLDNSEAVLVQMQKLVSYQLAMLDQLVPAARQLGILRDMKKVSRSISSLRDILCGDVHACAGGVRTQRCSSVSLSKSGARGVFS